MNAMQGEARLIEAYLRVRGCTISDEADISRPCWESNLLLFVVYKKSD